MSAFKSALLLVGIGLLVFGCANPTPQPSNRVRPLTHETSPLNLDKYHVVTVLPFESAGPDVKDSSVGPTFAKDVAWRLKNSYGSIFSAVNPGSPSGRDDELIVTGTFTKYNPGSREVRELVGLGLGAASLGGSVVLKSAADQHVVYDADFSKWWAWGGIKGAKGIDDLEAAAAISVANTIALAKGWSPPTQTGNEHPKYREYAATLEPVQPNRARLWIYRPNHKTGWNANLQIRVDGAYVGTAVNGGFFSVEVEPGAHEISQAILPKVVSATIDVPAGNQAYVMVLFSHGLSSYLPKPEVVTESKALSEIQTLELKGS